MFTDPKQIRANGIEFALGNLLKSLDLIDWDSLPQTTREKFKAVRTNATHARTAIAYAKAAE